MQRGKENAWLLINKQFMQQLNKQLHMLKGAVYAAQLEDVFTYNVVTLCSP